MSTVTTLHKNSKKITILRKTNFADAAQTGALEFMSLSKKSIGSYWESKNSKGIGCGLTFEEKKLLLPEIIDIPSDDKSFLPEVKKFYESIVTPVGYEEGATLEIGLKKSNSEPLSDENRPIHCMDFIRYRHALHHPRVADSMANAIGNMLVEFYIFDPSQQHEADLDTNKKKDEALKAYFLLKEDSKKVDAMLVLMKVDPRTFYGPLGATQKIEKLRDLADTQAASFLEEYEGKMFEEKYLVMAMTSVGIIRRVGNQYINAETGKIIGNNTEEAQYFFKDPINSDQVSILKAHLQEAMKKEVKSKTRRIPVGRV